MPIRNPPRWALAEREATPEAAYFDRRALMKASGAALMGLGALAACDAPANGTPKPAPPDPNASLYPARRNAAFLPPLPLTPEKLPLSYNNYYESGDSKDIADA